MTTVQLARAFAFVSVVLALSEALIAQPGSLLEAKWLDARVESLQASGQFSSAITLAKRALAIRERILGSNHPETATALNNLAFLYHATGDYRSAEPLFVQALAISESVQGAEHPETATSLNNLGELYRAIGAYAKAEPFLTRALTICEKALGTDHPDTAMILNNLGLLQKDKAEYKQAEPLLRRALAINEKVFGPRHAATLRSVGSLADLYVSIGAFAQAEPLFLRVLDTTEKVLGPTHPETAANFSNIAEFYRLTGEYARAEPLLTRALTISETVLGREHPHTGTVLNNFGVLYQVRGDYLKAEPLLMRALAIREKVLGPEHTETAVSLNNVALLYLATERYAEAERVFNRALDIQKNVFGAQSAPAAFVLNNLGSLYESTGAYGEAIGSYALALEIREAVLGSGHAETAASLNNLAGVYRKIGAYSKAEPLYTRALAIREKVFGREHPDIATGLNNLGALYEGMGDHAKAEPLFIQALAIREKVLGPERSETAEALNNLGSLYMATGAHSQAQALLTRALAIQEKVLGSDHPRTALTLTNLATFHWAQGDLVEAATNFMRAGRARESSAKRIFALGYESRKSSYAQSLMGETSAIVTLALSARPRMPDLEAFATEVVLQRKGRVLDVMADNLAAIRRNLAPTDQQLLERWLAATTQFETLLGRGPGDIRLDSFRETLDQLEDEAIALETQLNQRSPAFKAQAETVTLARVQQVIPEDAVLVEWLRYYPYNPVAKKWGPSRYAAFVLKHAGTPAAVDLGEAETIETTIRDLLVVLRDPHSTIVPELARELYTLLLEPLRPHLGQPEWILMSPDGPLSLLPFGVLLDDQKRHLSDVSGVTYLTGGRDLLRVDGMPSRQPPVVIADPDFGTADQVPAPGGGAAGSDYGTLLRGLLPFGALPGTGAEAMALQRLLDLDVADVLTRDKATEAAVKRLQGPRILHLATHGFFLSDVKSVPPPGDIGDLFDDHRPYAVLEENPLLRSGLALAGANRLRSGDDNGILTAMEVARLDLMGTELAVLSACEAGIGQVQNGEGVYGLRRALFLAGVQTQLTSLWKVDDLATKDLMLEYYERLSDGVGRSTALRMAQAAIRKDPARRHPYYWAGYVVIGDPRPLTRLQDRRSVR